jgi:hypothetical protein
MGGSGIKTGHLFVQFLCSVGGLPPLKIDFDLYFDFIFKPKKKGDVK